MFLPKLKRSSKGVYAFLNSSLPSPCVNKKPPRSYHTSLQSPFSPGWLRTGHVHAPVRVPSWGRVWNYVRCLSTSVFWVVPAPKQGRLFGRDRYDAKIFCSRSLSEMRPKFGQDVVLEKRLRTRSLGEFAAGLQPCRLASAAGMVYTVLSPPSSEGCPLCCSSGSERTLYRLWCVWGTREKLLSVSNGVSPPDLTWDEEPASWSFLPALFAVHPGLWQGTRLLPLCTEAERWVSPMVRIRCWSQCRELWGSSSLS